MLPIYPHSSRHGELARKLRGVAARTRASIVFVTTLLACSASATSVGIDPLDVVRQVVAEKCASCHSGQGPGPFALLTDGDLARHGPTMVRAVETTLMPPWLPAASASGLRDECRLSTDEIAAFRAWKAAGFPLTPRGENPPPDDRLAREPPAPTLTPTAGSPLTVEVARGWFPNPQDPDALRSFAVALNNEHALRIRGWHATRDASSAAARYNLLVSASPAALELDESDPGLGYGRLGDLADRTSGSAGAIGVDGSFELPPGFALEIPPRATLVAEVITSGKGRPLDAGAVLRAIPATANDRVVRDFCVIPGRSAPAIRADASVRVTTEPLDTTLDLVAIVLRPDMRARAVSVRRIDESGVESPLVEIPNYLAMLDRGYVFATALQLRRGDRIRYEVTFDTPNSANRATPVAVLFTALPLDDPRALTASAPAIATTPALATTTPVRVLANATCAPLGIELIAVDGADNFRMSATEITQQQFSAVLRRNPSLFHEGDEHLDRPVDSATWFDAAEFCNQLSVRAGLPIRYELSSIERDSSARITSALVRVNPTNGFRLPSEAEWLRGACTVNSSTVQSLRIDLDVEKEAWMSPWAQNISHAVATKKPNALGFFDLAGNVWEWCEDAWIDPTSSGPVQRVIRGGAWCDLPAAAACDFRSGIPAGTTNSPFGFRIAIDGLHATRE